MVMKRQLLKEGVEGVPVEGSFIMVLLNLETVNVRLFGEVRVGKNGFMALAAILPPGPVWVPNQEVSRPEQSDFLETSQQWRMLSDIPPQYRSIILDKRKFPDTPFAIVGVASLNDVRDPVLNLVYTSILFGIFALIMGIFGAFFFSEKLTSPIRELTKKARQFATGGDEAKIGGASHIVTGDRRHLLPLGSYQGISIVSAADFFALVSQP